MFHTFYSSKDTLYISAKVYSDFGSLIPLIRFFPQGLNFPIEHPLFPNEPIRYHFLFYAPIGFFENLGLPLGLALNIPSSLGFFSLLFLIYYLGRKAGFLAVILFLFNSSLSFIDFIHKPSFTNFVSFRPWNESQIAAFWNLNIYTNQRHLGFSFAVCLLIVLILYRLKNHYLYITGFLFGSLLLLNQAGFLISTIFIIFAFLVYPQTRSRLLISFIGFIPWLILYKLIFPLPDMPFLNIGFLSDRPINIFNFIKFWISNYGLSLILIFPAFYYLRNKILIPLLFLFIIGNTFQLSPDIINNHKIFNFLFIINGIFIAKLLLKYQKLFIIFPILIFGGVIDFFPIINDRYIKFDTTEDQKYFSTLPKDSVILNSTWFYHPASLAGLTIYNGYPYFTWSYGYNQVERERQTINLYGSETLCQDLNNTGITHIELSPSHESFINPSQILKTSIPSYENKASGLKVYTVADLCPNS